ANIANPIPQACAGPARDTRQFPVATIFLPAISPGTRPAPAAPCAAPSHDPSDQAALPYANRSVFPPDSARLAESIACSARLRQVKETANTAAPSFPSPPGTRTLPAIAAADSRNVSRLRFVPDLVNQDMWRYHSPKLPRRMEISPLPRIPLPSPGCLPCKSFLPSCGI